jgi:hypothetical protein
MPSQLGKCRCCKCDDCKCRIILERGGGFWAPPPVVKCKRNTVHGRYIFKDSFDCSGFMCDRQEGCTVSKVCLDRTNVFRIRVWGQLEIYRSGMHIGKIQYRKLHCNKPNTSWTTLVEISSKGAGIKCCKACVCDECLIKLPRGKYEFRFSADSVDGIDHCENYLQYDMKWCPIQCKDRRKKNCNIENCCPKLPEPPGCNTLCCSGLVNPCASVFCAPACDCPPGYVDPCTEFGWIIIPCDSISLV